MFHFFEKLWLDRGSIFLLKTLLNNVVEVRSRNKLIFSIQQVDTCQFTELCSL